MTCIACRSTGELYDRWKGSGGNRAADPNIHIEDETYDALEAIILRHMPEAHGCARASRTRRSATNGCRQWSAVNASHPWCASTSLWRSYTASSATTDIDLAGPPERKAKAADAVAPGPNGNAIGTDDRRTQ